MASRMMPPGRDVGACVVDGAALVGDADDGDAAGVVVDREGATVVVVLVEATRPDDEFSVLAPPKASPTTTTAATTAATAAPICRGSDHERDRSHQARSRVLKP